MLVGVYPGLTPLDLQAVTFKELEVIGTRVYSRDDLHTAARMITSGAFDPRPLLTVRDVCGDLADEESFVRDLHVGQRNPPCHAVTW